MALPSDLLANSDVGIWLARLLRRVSSKRFLVLFLHGYRSPGFPCAQELRSFLDSIGADLWYATAPPGRVDPFNEEGEPSWFRYETDHTTSLPTAFDRPNMIDVTENLTQPVVVVDGPGAPRGKQSLMAILAARNRRVLLCGESQGAVMAALLASEHARRCRDRPLAGVFLLRGAPDPYTWLPKWPGQAGDIVPASALACGTPWGAFIGGRDEEFPEAFVRYALSPSKGARVAVAAGVDHYASNDFEVYRRAFATFLLWALDPRSIAFF